jgi:manganese/zinc/iron transport system permease protein
MIWLGAVIAAASAVLGHVAAIEVPTWFGLGSTTTAGMMAVVVGLFFTAALFLSPRQGVVVRAWRRMRLSLRILGEDVLGVLYRAEEQESEAAPAALSAAALRQLLLCKALPLRLVLWERYRRGLVSRDVGGIRLTDKGAMQARELIRSHRLWEHYLVERAGLPPDRIHLEAERLEHITDRAMRDLLDQETSITATDPHGKAIPDEPESG